MGTGSHMQLLMFRQTYSVRPEQDPDPIFFLNEDKGAWILLRSGQFGGLDQLEKPRKWPIMGFARIKNNLPID
jgi:hypothetical protein